MSEQENIKIARATIDSINRHDLAANDKYFADDIRATAPGVPSLSGREQNRQYVQQFITAFPDLHFDIKDVIAQGDKVALTWVAKGTHQAPLTSPDGVTTIPATHKTTNVPGVTVMDIRNNMIVRQDIYWDMVTLLTQLGVNVAQQQSGQRR